jgi:hypothetical protein
VALGYEEMSAQLFSSTGGLDGKKMKDINWYTFVTCDWKRRPADREWMGIR